VALQVPVASATQAAARREAGPTSKAVGCDGKWRGGQDSISGLNQLVRWIDDGSESWGARAPFLMALLIAPTRSAVVAGQGGRGADTMRVPFPK
jgi:hypothetical protein